MVVKQIPCAASPIRPSQPTHSLRAARRAAMSGALSECAS
jgi:hypothetical protein